ncbi:MAG TPA: hypothetical protein VLS51_12140 [Propionibacteriaceae bacterium]|nr:hypothetical protein [Propionibacteriaceae bacterium]
MLDFLPAWLRHFILMYAAIFAYIVAQAIVKSDGVTTVSWLGSDGVLVHAVDGAAVAVAASLLLFLAPFLTKQYGFGKATAAMGSAGDVPPDATVNDVPGASAVLTSPAAATDPATPSTADVAP